MAAERLPEAPWPRRAASGRRRRTAPQQGGHGPAACARPTPGAAHARAPPPLRGSRGAARNGGGGPRAVRRHRGGLWREGVGALPAGPLSNPARPGVGFRWDAEAAAPARSSPVSRLLPAPIMSHRKSLCKIWVVSGWRFGRADLRF